MYGIRVWMKKAKRIGIATDMIYDYECEECGKVFEEVRTVADRDTEARCDCGGLSKRIFSFKGCVGVGTFKEGYYHAFGQPFTSEGQLKEHLTKLKGETGKEIVEVGNDSLQTVKKQRKKVDWDAAGRELRYKLRHGRANSAGSAED